MLLENNQLEHHAFVAEVVNFEKGHYRVLSVPPKGASNELAINVVWHGGDHIDVPGGLRAHARFDEFKPVVHAKIIRAIKNRLKQKGYEPLWNHYRYVIKPLDQTTRRVEVIPIRTQGPRSVAVVGRVKNEAGPATVEVKSWLEFPPEFKIWQFEIEQAVLYRCSDLASG